MSNAPLLRLGGALHERLLGARLTSVFVFCYMYVTLKLEEKNHLDTGKA